jgi:hypothetical protein
MRDLDTINAELRLIAVVRGAIRAADGPMPSSKSMDELLDARVSCSMRHPSTPTL